MIFKLFRDLFGKYRQHRPLSWLLKVSGLLFFLFWLYGFLFMYTENVDWIEAFWQSWQTFTTVGYGNQPAVTPAGRLATVIICTIGIALLGAVFTAAFDYRNYLSDRKRLGLMPNPYKNGYVIFNFPGEYQLRYFIRELRNTEPEVGICLVDSSLDELPVAFSSTNKLHFVKGNLLSKETYVQAEINHSKAVIIFPKHPSDPETDGTTKTIVDLVRRFVTEKTRILHVLVDPANAWMFDGDQSVGVLEGFEIFALVQECQDPYTAKIVETLLLNTEGGNPLTFRADQFGGWTWEEFVDGLWNTSRKSGLKCLPLALVKGGKVEHCPDFHTIIHSEDYLALIAHNEFPLETFKKQLLASKTS